MGLQRELATPCIPGQPRQLGGHRKSRVEMNRSPERPAAAVESERECCRITDAPRHFHRILAERDAARLCLGAAIPGDAESAQDLGPQLAVPRYERTERLLEQFRVGSAHAKPPLATHAENGAGEKGGTGGIGYARELARDRGGPPKHVTSLGDISRLPERFPQTNQKLGLSRSVGAAKIDHLQGTPVLRRGVLVRQHRHGPVPGARRVRDGPIRLAAGLDGPKCVIRELRQDVSGARRARYRGRGVEHRLEHLGDLAVELGAPRGVQLFVQRFADQCVGEAVPAHCMGNDRDDARGDRLLDRALELLTGWGQSEALTERLQRGETPLVAKDGGDDEHVLACGRERLQPLANCCPHAVGNRQQRGVTHGHQPRISDEETHDFGEEKRIAVSLCCDRGDQLRSRRGACGVLDELGDLTPGQTSKRQTLDSRVPHQLAQDPCEWMLTVEPDVAVRGDDQQPGPRQIASEKSEQQQ